MIVVDSDVLIDFLRGKAAAKNKLTELSEQGETLSTTAVNAFEVLRGEILNGDEGSYAKAKEVLASLSPIPFDSMASEVAADLYAELRRTGALIYLADPLIAAISQAHDAPLLTQNQKHFSHLKGLKLLGM